MIIYRASELGSCTRRLVLKRVGYDEKPAPDKFIAFFERGNEIEVEVKADLRATGFVIEDEQKELNLNVTNEIVVQGHVDGMIHHPTEVGWQNVRRVLEVKSMNDAYWNYVKRVGVHEAEGLMVKYRWQISAYMLASGLEAMFVFRNKDTGEDQIHVLEVPPHRKNDVFARVLVIEGRARSFTTEDFPCDQNDYPCPFYYTHPVPAEEELAPDIAEQVESLAIAYSELGDRERDAKEERKRLKASIENLLGERGTVRVGRARVTRYARRSTRFDKVAAERDGVEIAKYESTTTSDQLRITVGPEIGDE